MDAPASALLGFGYVAAIGVIARFVPVVRERRWRWLAVHHLGMTAIVAGWMERRQLPAVAVNSSWLVASSLWYALGARDRRPADLVPAPAD